MSFPKRKFFTKEEKYRNTVSERPGGLSFASKLEASVYDMLYLQEKTGQIKIEEIQSSVKLTKAQIRCIPDFRIFDNELKCQVWIEAKGFETERWLLIKRLWAWYGPGPLRVYKRSRNNIYLDEVVIPGDSSE